MDMRLIRYDNINENLYNSADNNYAYGVYFVYCYFYFNKQEKIDV